MVMIIVGLGTFFLLFLFWYLNQKMGCINCVWWLVVMLLLARIHEQFHGTSFILGHSRIHNFIGAPTFPLRPCVPAHLLSPAMFGFG